MVVREMKPGEELVWDNYVSKNEFSTPLQLAAWKTIFTKVYNSKTHYLLVEENGAVTGVLPLLHIKSLIAGNYVTSFPGGLLANDNDTASLLLNHGKLIVEKNHAKYLILRDGRIKWQDPELITDEEHINLIIHIHSDLGETRNSMKRRVRTLVNRSLNNGLKANHGWDLQSDFYHVYSLAMREIGTPTFGRKFFNQIHLSLRQNLHPLTISRNGDILGGGYIVPHRNCIHCLWSGLLKDYYDLYISHFLYWEVIRFAYQKGYEHVNLGRCRKESGLYFFKKGFGGRVQPLYQQFYLHEAQKRPPVGAEIEDELKYRVFTTAWRFLPHKVTEILGPEIRKVIPFG